MRLILKPKLFPEAKEAGRNRSQRGVGRPREPQ